MPDFLRSVAEPDRYTAFLPVGKPLVGEGTRSVTKDPGPTAAWRHREQLIRARLC
jgi:hypothetical protein